MSEERCLYTGSCEFRNKCSCNGDAARFCKTTDRIGGLVFVEKGVHQQCVAKTYFGDTHICLCPAKLCPEHRGDHLPL